MQTPSPAPIEYVSNLKRALIFKQITERDFYPFAAGAPGRSLLSSTVPGTQTLIDQTYRAWAYGQMNSEIVADPQNFLGPNDSFGGPAPSDFVDDLRRSLLYGGITYTDLGDFFIPPYGATFWRDFRVFQTLNHGVGIPLSCSRSSPASYFDSNGEIQQAVFDAPRFDYDPDTLEFKGLLIEGSRRNVILNSQAPVTQSISPLSSGAYTLSFYGTGTVTISGDATASLTGSGAFPTRSSIAVTVSSPGNITVSVSGDVQFAQLEFGPFPSSWIPTGGTAVTRLADQISSTTLGLPSSVFNEDEGTLYCSYVRENITPNLLNGIFCFRKDNSNGIGLMSNQTSPEFAGVVVREGGVERARRTSAIAQANGVIYKTAGTYKAFDNVVCQNTTLSNRTTTNGILPTSLDSVILGFYFGFGSTALYGHIQQLAYMPTVLSNPDLVDITS